MFQTTVPFNLGLGVVGELFDDAPVRSQPFILDSASALNNVIGRGFSISAPGVARAGNSGALPFAGILANTKTAASYGVTGDTLGDTVTLPDYKVGEFVTMGSIVVALPAVAAIGNLVLYDGTTGALTTIAAGADLPVGRFFTGGVVTRFAQTESGGGLAVIQLTDAPVPPVPAA